MKLRLRDLTWALLIGTALLGCAALILFLIDPGGFEGQVGWFLALMPGAIVGLTFADRVYRIAPHRPAKIHTDPFSGRRARIILILVLCPLLCRSS